MQGLFELAFVLAAAGVAAWWWRGRAPAEYADDFETFESTEDFSAPGVAPRRPDAAQALSRAQQRESVKLGHIILDWLKNIQFSDKSIHEILDTGEPEAKQEAREQLRGIVAQALGQFKDYMGRALALDPQLAQGDRVRESFRVASVLEHAIKLLAALEKPVSIAQTQQISTDVTQQPEHWNQLKDQTVDRLMDTLKGGLEEALGAMEQQEQDMERQQAEMEQVEVAQDHHHRRRKRRRRRQGSSQASARKAARDITLDDQVLGEGAHLHRKTAAQRLPVSLSAPPVSSPPQRMAQATTNIDMDLIRQLGQTLARSSREALAAKGASADGASPARSAPAGLAMATVAADEPPRPDDITLSAQEMLRREREQPRGPRRPNQPRQG